MPPRFPRRGFFWPPIPLPPVLSPRRATQLSERSPSKNLDVLGELAYGLSQDPHLCPTPWSTEGHTRPPPQAVNANDPRTLGHGHAVYPRSEDRRTDMDPSGYGAAGIGRFELYAT